MTATLERPTWPKASGDAALETIDAYRGNVNERFKMAELDREFAFYTHRLGATGLYLADATDNAAGTFKWRGALNKIAQLKEEGVESVVVPSAGNHLRGAVLAAKALDMTLHGVVPTSAPPAKKEGARKLWDNPTKFKLHVEGGSFDESLAWALANPELGELVHPFDDADVAAGQGTLADDMLAEAAQAGVNLQHVVVTVGGGGLAHGLARRFHELGSAVTVHGMEGRGNDSLSRSHDAGQVVAATGPNPSYGGAAVKHTGQLSLQALQTLPNLELGRVADEEVRALAEDYMDEIAFRDLRGFSPLEPTSLVAVAGMAQVARQHPGHAIAAVGTGRNDSLAALWDK